MSTDNPKDEFPELEDAFELWREDAARTAQRIDVHGDLADRIVAAVDFGIGGNLERRRLTGRRTTLGNRPHSDADCEQGHRGSRPRDRPEAAPHKRDDLARMLARRLKDSFVDRGRGLLER